MRQCLYGGMLNRRIYRIIGLFFVSLMIWLPHSFSQGYITKKTASEKVLKWYEKGLEEIRNGDTDKAILFLEKCLDAEPDFLDALLHWGGILYDRNDLKGAELRFEKVVNLNRDYLPRVWYTLGMISWRLRQFENAAIRFETFLDLEQKNEILIDKARKYLSDSRFAKDALLNPVPFHPVPLGEGVNTSMAEYLPTVTADGELLVFTRVVDGQEDFFESHLKEGSWMTAVPIGALNTPLNEAAQAISADGKYLAFTACNRSDGYGSCDIYLSERKNDQWQLARNLGPPVNTSSWESQPSISANGQELYFSSNRSGGIGGKDIWMSVRQQNGSWSEPINLGSTVNTERDEQSPFIHADNTTLYFESEGHPGMGGHDLFVSRLDSAGSWSAPQNLGYPINTPSNEGALFVDISGRLAYFATDRHRDTGEENQISAFDNPAGGRETDLFQFVLPPKARARASTYLKAKVFSSKTRLPLEGAIVELVDLSADRQLVSEVTDRDGAFFVCLPSGRNYALHVTADGYLFSSQHFALEQVHTIDAPYFLKIWLEPVANNHSDEKAQTKPVVLRNVFFETGSAELLPASLHELNRLKDLLMEQETIRIELRGHTDNVGSEADNLLLSEDRAKAVFDFLCSQGIDSSRLEYRGYGETVPVASNETPEGRQENRRTEFMILNP